MKKKDLKKRVKELEEDVGRIAFIVDELAKKQFGTTKYGGYYVIDDVDEIKESPLMRLFREMGED